jgi:hypothetical protein
MLDPVAPIRIGHGIEGALESIERLLDRSVPDRMNGKLVALGMVVLHEVVHFGVLEKQEPMVIRCSEVRFRHRRRASTRASVGENLDRSDAEH